MKKLLTLLLILVLTLPSAAASTYSIDFSRAAEGVVHVKTNTGIKTKVIVKKDTETYTYNAAGDETLPLQLGGGKYQITIFENVTANQYRKVYAKSAEVKTSTQFQPFLASNQQVNWKDSAAEEVAASLVSKRFNDRQKLVVLRNYVANNIKYDYDKIDSLNYDYVPDFDDVLAASSGICYDYSVVLASLLRAQGIPTKLVKGYSSLVDGYHAWNEVYLAAEGKWIIVDATVDAALGSKAKLEKSAKDYFKKYEY